MEFFTRQWLLGKVKPHYGYLALLGCCVANGLIDAAVFNNYGVFAAMQTGNTVILCLNTARLPAGNTYAYAKTLVVLISFFIGAVITSHIWGALPGGALRRLHVTTNFALQAAMIFVSAALVQSGVIPTDNRGGEGIISNPKVIGLLPPLAFQAGAQIASSRLLGFGQEIPVNVLTSTYAALAADPRLLKWPNPPRDRRVLAVICTLIGALISAWLQKKSAGITAVFWMAGGIKALIAIGCYFGLASAEKKVEVVQETSAEKSSKV